MQLFLCFLVQMKRFGNDDTAAEGMRNVDLGSTAAGRTGGATVQLMK
jgi:hypothetical protein